MLEKSQTIEFYYEDIDFELDHQESYVTWLNNIASSHERSIGELSYIFSNDEKVLEINKQYLDHDYYTDIISFPYDLEPIAGDIYISIDRVKDNASDLGIQFQEELHRVMAHGLLHFIGFDDHSEEDILAMRNAENAAIEQYKIWG